MDATAAAAETPTQRQKTASASASADAPWTPPSCRSRSSSASGAIMRLGDTARATAVDVDPHRLDLARSGPGRRRRARAAASRRSSAQSRRGKTTLCSHRSPTRRSAGGIAAFIDAEHALDPSYARSLRRQHRRAARLPAGHRRAGAGDLRDAGPLQRRRRHRHRLRRRAGPARRDRRRDGRLARRASRPA